MNKTQIRPKVGIILDYSIRIPDFKDCYTKLKEQIFVGMSAAAYLDDSDIEIKKKNKEIDKRNYWNLLQKTDSKAVEFYTKASTPEKNYGPGFDIIYKKYFYNDEHKFRFLEEWSYNLFGQGSVTNKADINLINVAQTKLFDVILIDRGTHIRKVPNTFAFLARSGVFCKQVLFISSQEELDNLHKELFAIWDPFTDSNQIIEPTNKFGQPSKHFLDWLMGLETKLK